MTSSKDAWSTVARYRDELNTNGRKIALGGAALAWTLKTGNSFPSPIGVSLIFFVLFFLNDLIQLFVGYHKRRNYLRALEQKYKQDGIEKPLEANYSFNQGIEKWPYRLSISKWVLLSVAFAFLLYYLWSIVDPLAPLWELFAELHSARQSP